MANQQPFGNSLIGKSIGGQAKYFSAADAVLYINGKKLSTAVSVAFQMDESRIPLYGYNDRLYRSVTTGRVQIRGVIEVNFLYKGLLELLILGDDVTDELKKAIDKNPYLSSALKSINEKRGKERPKSGIKESDLISFIQEQVTDASLTNQERSDRIEQLTKFLEGEYFPPSPEAATAAQIIQKPFDMSIFYSNHNKIDPSLGTRQLGRINVLSETLKECYIIGKSKTLRSEAGGPDGGGSPILESYQFLARQLV